MPVASEEFEVDIEVEEMKDSSEEDFDEKEDEEEAGEEYDRPHRPLKIRLKLGAQPETKPASRRLARIKNEDIESEDSDSDESQFNYSAGHSSSRQLTARQAVLASAVDPSHVALDTKAGSSKKAQFTASEVALRKEENARKRKNIIQKKLEDEKAETIHRLLKKQSRPKNKRNTAAQSEEYVDMDEDDGASQLFSGPVLHLEARDDGEEFSEDKDDYEEPEEGGKNRKQKPPRGGAPKKQQKMPVTKAGKANR
ncbi:hypothetical protein B0H13DRAFT_2335239 [Mycena leptocephala]|nr:hypothetical protein B0H13DRAFT_2335239 [Mycena leptocephala]